MGEWERAFMNYARSNDGPAWPYPLHHTIGVFGVRGSCQVSQGWRGGGRGGGGGGGGGVGGMV